MHAGPSSLTTHAVEIWGRRGTSCCMAGSACTCSRCGTSTQQQILSLVAGRRSASSVRGQTATSGTAWPVLALLLLPVGSPTCGRCWRLSLNQVDGVPILNACTASGKGDRSCFCVVSIPPQHVSSPCMCWCRQPGSCWKRSPCSCSELSSLSTRPLYISRCLVAGMLVRASKTSLTSLNSVCSREQQEQQKSRT